MAVTGRRAEFWAGARATIPLIVGAIPFGIIFGAVAVTGGLSPAATAAMSAFVFAGSAQFAAAGLVAGGAGVLIIVFTTFVINLRHAFYGATLAPYVRHLPQRWLAPLGFLLTDETFLVVSARYRQPDGSPYRHWYYLGSAVFMYVNWQICTLIGLLAGQSIPDPARWGLDFALPVTFIGMLVSWMRSRPVVVCVLVSAVSALLLRDLPYHLALIVAPLAGIASGVLAERAGHGRRPQAEGDR